MWNVTQRKDECCKLTFTSNAADVATFRIKALDFANLSARRLPKRRAETSVGGRERRSARRAARDFKVRSGPARSVRAREWFVWRVPRRKIEWQANAPTICILVRYNYACVADASHRSLTMPRGDGLSPDCDTWLENLLHSEKEIDRETETDSRPDLSKKLVQRDFRVKQQISFLKID